MGEGTWVMPMNAPYKVSAERIERVGYYRVEVVQDLCTVWEKITKKPEKYLKKAQKIADKNNHALRWKLSIDD